MLINRRLLLCRQNSKSPRNVVPQHHRHVSAIPLPFSPRPHADELISSWLARIASQYNITTPEFLDFIGWSGKDIDYDPAPSDIQKLSTYTNFSISQIRGMTLKAHYPRRRRTDFFPMLLRSKHLPVFCGGCLERDIRHGRQPYWRYHWASIWSSRCKIDGFLLVSNCETMSCYLSGRSMFQLIPCHLCKARPLYPNADITKFSFSPYAAPEADEVDIKATSGHDYILCEFEEAMEKALDGIAPGPQWWCGHSAASFRRVASELVPFIILKQEAYTSPHQYPAKTLLRYNGIQIKVRKGEAIDSWTEAWLGGVSETWRYIALKALARIMIQPTACCILQFMCIFPGCFYYFNFHRDLLHVLLSTLSQANLQQAAAIASQWPHCARSRVYAYLAAPRSFYLL